MSTNLATRPRSTLSPGLPAEILVSSELAAAYEATRNPHPDVGRPRAYPSAVQSEARRVIESLWSEAQPVSQAMLRDWLSVIPASVSSKLTEDEAMVWLAVVAKAVGHLESGAFTAATQATALRTFKTFPSAAHVYEILAPAAVEIRQRLAALNHIANAPKTQGGN